MMTGVWEGVLYGLVNRDFAGAFVSPYSSLLIPCLYVLFFYLVKCLWNENMAFFVVLLFPFYSSWDYYGLGMLICLAAMAYIKRHTYRRAFLVWGAFIWCAIYRLDLGFAYGFALIISMAVYCFVLKDKIAARQLLVTLLGWGVAGGVLWCVLCIVKGVNPFSRLLEFLMVNLSNQNWAYAEIGNMTITLFGWAYIIVPFSVVIALIYVTFSQELRSRIGIEKWVLLQIFGWCYFGNFSRGLVRHSIAEMMTFVVIWCGYLFLAMTISYNRKNSKFFLPSFLMLILCNTLFLSDYNFTERSILDSAAERPASIVESWRQGRFDEEDYEQRKLDQERLINSGSIIANEEMLADKSLTYWEQLSKKQKIVQRVNLTTELQQYADKYTIVDKLLEKGETFADFINKTLIYCILGRKCPVYISQSPMQLSGEFMQEEFIRQIEDVPIILMPAEMNDRESQILDGITNTYRYYKVAEYIYQNYVPIYKYGTDYAIWCRPEKYEEYRKKLFKSVIRTEYVNSILTSENLNFNNSELYEEGGLPVIAYMKDDPMITELQTMIDISHFIGKEMMLTIEYETDTSGTMQFFYTTEDKEDYNGEKVVTVNVSGQGIAEFTIPITEYTRLRLDIPERSKVKISSLVACSVGEYISYGYDGPIESTNADGHISFSYRGSSHTYSLNHLPRIWAEGDIKRANDNYILQKLVNQGDAFLINRDFLNNENGNYLKITASYDGNDKDGLFQEDDEYLNGTVAFGRLQNGQFKEKYSYGLTFKEGQHDYLIRCSTDYFWYTGDVNAVQVRVNGVLHDMELNLLEGD